MEIIEININSQRMNKNEIDMLSTAQDASKSNYNSFQESYLLSNSRVEKSDAGTNTEHLLNRCSCEMIPKLKEKAHKAFMQVVEIQNLYKQQLEQLKEYYQEREKNRNKKFSYREQMLEQKCKELEQEIERVKEAYHREQAYQQTKPVENPFIVDSIDSIILGALPDDSCQSIYQNIKEFIANPNLDESAQVHKATIKQGLMEVKKRVNSEFQHKIDSDVVEDTFSAFLLTKLKQIEDKVESLFCFVESLIETAVVAGQKLNEMSRGASELENRYTKMYGVYESAQKETKFMTEHIKRLSRDNLKIKQKYAQLEKSNKMLEESYKQLKKSIPDQGTLSSTCKFKKPVASSKQIQIDDDELNASKGSMISSCTAKINSARQRDQDRLLPLSLNFKKKEPAKSDDRS